MDTIADITLNGVKLGHVENMHRTFEYSVKEFLKEEDNTLNVYFYSPTQFIANAFKKSPTLGTEDAMNGFVHIRKAHCMFGWDWGAHLPDAGIWRPVKLLGVDTARLESVEVLQYHEDKKVRLEVLEVRRDNFNSEQKYISHSYYYFCEVDEVISDTCMSENELARGYQLEWASMAEIIATNRILCTEIWQKRDLQLLEWVQGNMNK